MDLMPAGKETVYLPLMRRLGYDPSVVSTDIDTPAGIGNVACAAVLEFRHQDGSNQLGDLAQGPYSDWTGYTAVNPPSQIPTRPVLDPNHWQPLSYFDETGGLVRQVFADAQWCEVTPFAMFDGDQFRWVLRLFGPAIHGTAEYERQAQELVDISADLTDRQKAIAEYWSDGPNSEQPPGHWALLAQFVSERDRHNLDEDVKMFFVLANAGFDAGIAAWDAKRAYDSVRPLTAIPLLFGGKKIRAWGGPGKGTREIDGADWMPYQRPTFPTPPFPEFVSGHSAFSAAAAQTMRLWTGSDAFGASTTIAAGSSKIEPGLTPARPVILAWRTFSEAAEEAGISRRYGGIHFRAADLAGRVLGRLVAERVWAVAASYFDGSAPVRTLRQIQAGDKPRLASHGSMAATVR
jgi:hypothetical protein